MLRVSIPFLLENWCCSALKEPITATLAKVLRMSQKWVNSFFLNNFGRLKTTDSLNLLCWNLDGRAFSNINFEHSVTFQNSSLVGATFGGSIFCYAKVDFTSADIKNCDFRGMDFQSSSFKFLETAKNIQLALFDKGA